MPFPGSRMNHLLHLIEIASILSALYMLPQPEGRGGGGSRWRKANENQNALKYQTSMRAPHHPTPEGMIRNPNPSRLLLFYAIRAVMTSYSVNIVIGDLSFGIFALG